MKKFVFDVSEEIEIDGISMPICDIEVLGKEVKEAKKRKKKATGEASEEIRSIRIVENRNNKKACPHAWKEITDEKVKFIKMEIESDEVSLDCPVQRDKVWTAYQKAMFIVSIISNYTPSVAYVITLNGHKFYIDGKQRISTLVDFINGEFVINAKNLPLIAFTKVDKNGNRFIKFIDLDGYSFKDLEENFPDFAEDIKEYIFKVVYYGEMSNDEIVDLFTCLNAGTPLNEYCGYRTVIYKVNSNYVSRIDFLEGTGSRKGFFEKYLSEKQIREEVDTAEIIKAMMIIRYVKEHPDFMDHLNDKSYHKLSFTKRSILNFIENDLCEEDLQNVEDALNNVVDVRFDKYKCSFAGILCYIIAFALNLKDIKKYSNTIDTIFRSPEIRKATVYSKSDQTCGSNSVMNRLYVFKKIATDNNYLNDIYERLTDPSI